MSTPSEPRHGYLSRRHVTRQSFWRGAALTGSSGVPWSSKHTAAIAFQTKVEARNVIKQRALAGATVVNAGDPYGPKVDLI